MDFTALLDKISKKQILAIVTMLMVNAQENLNNIIAIAAVGSVAIIVQGVLDMKKPKENGNGG